VCGAGRRRDGMIMTIDRPAILVKLAASKTSRDSCRDCVSTKAFLVFILDIHTTDRSIPVMFIRHCVKSTSRSASTLSRVEASVTRSSLSARTLPHRYLSSSASRLASQEDEFASAFEQSPLFNVIKSHPTAMEAIRDIGDLMQKKGKG
jgi:hypothetical protein